MFQPELIIDHNAGFFSCCSVRLTKIIEFFNEYKRLPTSICYKKQFHNYKVDYNDPDEDLSSLYFKPTLFGNIEYNSPIDFFWEYQFKPYNTLDFENLSFFVRKYFNPSNFIHELINKTLDKYKINYQNIVGVCYRGNDKITETNIAGYELFFEQCEQIKRKEKNITFLIQTDELEFKNEFLKVFPDSFFLHEIPLHPKNNHCCPHSGIEPKNRPMFGALILHSIFILSQCKYLVTHSGNCGIWSVLYRGNTKNTKQYLKHANYNGWF